MASLTKDRRLLFKAPDGKRKTIRLGSKTPVKQARLIQRHVERLLACQLDGSAPPEETSRWAAGVSDTLRDRLSRAGLIEQRESGHTLTLSGLIERYKDRPRWRNLKESSRHCYNFGFRHLKKRFGADTPIKRITDAAAEELPDYLTEEKPVGAGLAKASAYRVCDTAVTIFRFAVKSRLLDRNPFDEVKRGSVPTSRRAYIGTDVAKAVLDELHDTQTQLIFGLARWGGLRVPSEPTLLRWADIDWARNRFLVLSPKTEHHEGHSKRWVPIFPELAQLFDARFEEAAEGDEFVLPMLQGAVSSCFRQKLSFAIKRAGHEQWPRICHSLRSTRQTELEQLWPTYVVCKWLGNSAIIANRHYLQVTDEHFAKAAHNPTQHTSAQSGIERNCGLPVL